MAVLTQDREETTASKPALAACTGRSQGRCSILAASVLGLQVARPG